MRRIARQTVEILEGNHPLAIGAGHANFASSAASATHMSDGWVAMQCSLAPRIACMRLTPADGAAAAARRTLVAWGRRVVKIMAARALEQIAADGGGIALSCALAPASSALDSSGKRVATRSSKAASELRTSAPMRRPPPLGLLDPVERQTVDIDQRFRPLDILLHQVERLVPPAMNLTPRTEPASRTASATSLVRT